MKRIAITQRLMCDPITGEYRDALDVRWGMLFEHIGWHLIAVPSGVIVQTFLQQANIHGIILSNGNDLSCVSPENTLSIQRDAMESTIASYALANHIPILGVCRGMQFLATYFGAKLCRLEGHINHPHSIIWPHVPSFLSNADLPFNVNSFHQYAVQNIPSILEAAAISEDGCIEAIYHKELPVFGLMWHPERENPFSGTQCGLLKSFFNDQ